MASAILTDLPELGQLDRRRIARLAGLAPLARDSGKREGPRAIRGGRVQIRSLLYIAALQASRRSPRFKAYRRNLTEKGKATKTAIIATARKLLTCLNAMLATNADYNEIATS